MKENSALILLPLLTFVHSSGGLWNRSIVLDNTPRTCAPPFAPYWEDHLQSLAIRKLNFPLEEPLHTLQLRVLAN